MKFITKGIVIIDSSEDGGQAKICESFPIETANSDGDNGMLVTIQSWDEDTVHADLNLILGRTVKITIEVIE
jgi:hypothetical protein